MGRITHLMTDSIWVKAPTGSHDNAGVPTYAAVVKLGARVEYETKVLAQATGRDVTATIKVAVETEITKGSLIFLSSADTSDDDNGYVVVEVKHAKSPLDSTGHWEVRA